MHEKEDTKGDEEWVGGARGASEMDGKDDKCGEWKGEGVGKKTRQSSEQAWRRSPGKHGRLADRVTSPRGSHSQHMLPY